MTVQCAKCGSHRVVPKATVWDQGDGSSGSLRAYVYAKPEAIFFRGTAYATLYSRICADCGYTEIYADGAKELYDAFLEGGSATSTAQEATPETCLACGKPLSEKDTACGDCGWSWKE